jgi:hypothetical protein
VGQQQLPEPASAVKCFKQLVYGSVNELRTSSVMVVSWLAEKVVLPNPCCHENLE